MSKQEVISNSGEVVGFLESFRAPSFSESRSGWNAISIDGKVIAGSFAYKRQALAVFGECLKTRMAS